jgi:hypothetical protein
MKRSLTGSAGGLPAVRAPGTRRRCHQHRPGAESLLASGPAGCKCELVSDSTFYSDRTGQAVPRVSEDVSPNAWQGLTALIQARVRDGSLARAFPLQDCVDAPARITGTDEAMFLDSLRAHIPVLGEAVLDPRHPPDTVTALDVVDFVARNVDQPSRRVPHEYFGHEHLSFTDHQTDGTCSADHAPGQARFRDDIDLIFARNGIAFALAGDMRVHRLGPPEARSLISDFRPATSDPQLDAMLSDATARFLSRNPADRLDSLEKLWDAFERLKTLEPGGRLKRSVTQLLDQTAAQPFRGVIEAEFAALTGIGNAYTIRHHGRSQSALPSDAAVDYLFTRLLGLIAFVLRQTARMSR